VRMLAIDTSSVACTVALGIGDEIIERHEEQPREHTRLLMPMIREVLEEAATELATLDAIVLGNGPGSFIGMRIAASVAQGLAHGAGLEIIPVSSLAIVAAEVFATSDAEQVVVAQDAHMQEVYLGIFARGCDDLPSPICDERLQNQEAIAGFDETGMMRRIAAGYGWQRYPNLMNLNRSFFREESNVLFPRARYLLALAGTAEAVAPENIDPAYLRKKVAQKPGTANT
jgi:tRNA threonylcarbamoyladenosine biosynthesis protein TsaB